MLNLEKTLANANANANLLLLAEREYWTLIYNFTPQLLLSVNLAGIE